MMNATNFVAAMPRLAASAATTAIRPPDRPASGGAPRPATSPEAAQGAGWEASPDAGPETSQDAGPGTGWEVGPETSEEAATVAVPDPGAETRRGAGSGGAPPDSGRAGNGRPGTGDAEGCPLGGSGGLGPESAVMSVPYAIRAFSSWIAAIGAGSIPFAIARYTEA